MLIINAGNTKSYLPKCFQENYTMKGEYDRKELVKNMMHLTIIQTKYIDEFIKDKKNKKIINSIGQLMYLFKNDDLCDTIGIDEKIQGVVKMHKEYMDSLEAERAYNIEREKMMIASEMSDAFDEGHTQGIDEGIEKGITQTLSIYAQSRFQVDIKEELQSLSLNQLDHLSQKIYTLETIEEIKELIRSL